jgi:DNA-binding MarR family transcriptional regulator
MQNDLFMDRNYKLWWLILQTGRALRKIRAKDLGKFGMTPEEASVFFIIRVANRKATPSEISRWTMREKHTISELLSRMEKKGLIRKVKDLERKNKVRVTTTRKGSKYYSKMNSLMTVSQIFNSLSEKELEQMRKTLEKIRNDALTLRGEGKPPFPVFE